MKTDNTLVRRANLPNEQEPIIDYQNRQIALRNRAIDIQSEWFDISDDQFNNEDEPIKI